MEFKKEDTKEYKKLDTTLKAAARTRASSFGMKPERSSVRSRMTFRRERCRRIRTATFRRSMRTEHLRERRSSETVAAVTGDNEQETQQENAEDDENASNEDKATNPPTEQENGENGANTEDRTEQQRTSRRTRSSSRR